MSPNKFNIRSDAICLNTADHQTQTRVFSPTQAWQSPGSLPDSLTCVSKNLSKNK